MVRAREELTTHLLGRQQLCEARFELAASGEPAREAGASLLERLTKRTKETRSAQHTSHAGARATHRPRGCAAAQRGPHHEKQRRRGREPGRSRRLRSVARQHGRYYMQVRAICWRLAASCTLSSLIELLLLYSLCAAGAGSPAVARMEARQTPSPGTVARAVAAAEERMRVSLSRLEKGPNSAAVAPASTTQTLDAHGSPKTVLLRAFEAAGSSSANSCSSSGGSPAQRVEEACVEEPLTGGALSSSPATGLDDTPSVPLNTLVRRAEALVRVPRPGALWDKREERFNSALTPLLFSPSSF